MYHGADRIFHKIIDRIYACFRASAFSAPLLRAYPIKKSNICAYFEL